MSDLEQRVIWAEQCGRGAGRSWEPGWPETVNLRHLCLGDEPEIAAAWSRGFAAGRSGNA